MKQLLILLILLFALPAYAQQCTEETPCPELARLSPAMMGSVPVVAGGVIAYVNGAGTAESTSQTQTKALITPWSVTAGNLVVVMVMSYNIAPGAGEVTDDALNTYTRNNTYAGGAPNTALYSSIVGTGGTLTITYDPAGTGSTYMGLVVAEFSGVKSTGAYEAGDNNSYAATTNPTATVTTTAATLITGIFCSGTLSGISLSMTAGAGFTQIAEISPTDYIGYSALYQIYTTFGAKSVEIDASGSSTITTALGAFLPAP